MHPDSGFQRLKINRWQLISVSVLTNTEGDCSNLLLETSKEEETKGQTSIKEIASTCLYRLQSNKEEQQHLLLLCCCCLLYVCLLSMMSYLLTRNIVAQCDR